ncbi:MAG: RNA methyltransferase [Bacteroidetes bacterium]|nr:RNA methyltransferase [Bacteroidota bacterium]
MKGLCAEVKSVLFYQCRFLVILFLWALAKLVLPFLLPQIQIYLCPVKSVNSQDISPTLLSYLQGFLLDERKQRFEEVLEKRTRHLTCVLENIVDPHNANAVMRSCECFGIQDVHIIENGAKFKPAKKVLQGAHKWLTVHRYNGSLNNTKQCMDLLHEKGYKIVATSPKDGHPSIHNIDLSVPIAVVMGQENIGISEIVKQEADAFVRIPMHGFTESLNISVAGAILLQELSHRIRKTTGINWSLSETEKNDLRAVWTLKNLYRNELLIERFYQDRENK